jgi:hypothetical protein
VTIYCASSVLISLLRLEITKCEEVHGMRDACQKVSQGLEHVLPRFSFLTIATTEGKPEDKLSKVEHSLT